MDDASSRLVGVTLATSFGPLSVLVDPGATGDRSGSPAGAVVAAGFGDREQIAAGRDVAWDGGSDLLGFVADCVARWDDGTDLKALDLVPVAVTGPGFAEAAWRALRQVPPGSTVTYTDLATAAGNPRAARAAGSACATNPVAPFVPCHRVVPVSGGVGHYGFGSARKHEMLDHEGASLRSTRAVRGGAGRTT